jgi:hypothetical protein
MRLRLQQTLSLAGLTLLDCFRQPQGLLLTVGILAGMGILPLVVTHQFGETGKLIRDSVLALHLLGGLLLAAQTATGGAAGGRRDGTTASLLVKPVHRVDIVLGRFLGLAGFALAYGYAAGVAVVLAARTSALVYEIDLWGSLPLLGALALALAAAGAVNYLAQRPFVSTAWMCLLLALTGAVLLSGFRGGEIPGWSAFGAALDGRLPVACALLALAVLVLQALAYALAVRLEALPVVTLAFALFLLGLMSDHLFGRAAATSIAAGLAYAITPNWSVFWMADALTGGGRIDPVYLRQAAGYAALYTGAMLAVAVALFDRAEAR